jgi:hypothetical protein
MVSTWVNLLGFAGVCLTLFINHYFTRLRRLAESAHERDVLRAALIAELRAYKTNLIYVERSIRNEEHNDYFSEYIPAAHYVAVYASAVPKLGLLKLEQASQTITTYASLQSADRMIMRIIDVTGKRLGDGFFIKPDDRGVLLDLMRRERDLIDLTIGILKDDQ